MAGHQKLRLGLWFRYWAGLRLAPHVATPAHVAHRMLKLAAVGPADRVVDLGCGDARLLIAAAKDYGAQGYGVELDPALFAEAERAVADERLGHLITVAQKDAFTVDLTKATVLTLYLSTKGNARLLPMMRQQLPAGCTKLVTLSEGVKQVWPASAIDRLVREFPEVGGNVSSIWLVRELYLEPGAGAVSAIARLVREALGVETGDALASIDWLTREALGDTTGDALAIAWLVREFLGDRGELLRF